MMLNRYDLWLTFVHEYHINDIFMTLISRFFSPRLFTSTISEDTKGFIDEPVKLHTKDQRPKTRSELRIMDS